MLLVVILTLADRVSEVVTMTLGEHTLVGLQMQSSLFQMVEDLFEMFDIVLKIRAKDDNIIDVGSRARTPFIIL